MPFAIRNYRPGDFRTLLAIDQACFAPGIAYSAFELKTYILRRGSFTFVAESSDQTHPAQSETTESQPDDSILGFIVGERIRGIGHITTIDVREAVRRQRVGSVLLQFAEDELRSHRCEAVRLETAVDNTSALSFYKRHGFHVVKTIPRYYSNGVDALLLEKHLLSAPSSG